MMIMQPAFNTVARMSNALFVASAVTFGLLCLMNFLIETDLEEPVADTSFVAPQFVQEPKEIEPIEKPPKEELIEPTPPPELPANNHITEFEPTNLGLMPSVEKGLGKKIEIFNPRDGEHVRLVATAATYPMRAIERGIEGHVDIRFDILKNGTTANVQILDSQPSSIFDRAVLKAVAKWKYQPRMESGKPVEVFGVMERVSFQLEN